MQICYRYNEAIHNYGKITMLSNFKIIIATLSLKKFLPISKFPSIRCSNDYLPHTVYEQQEHRGLLSVLGDGVCWFVTPCSEWMARLDPLSLYESFKSGMDKQTYSIGSEVLYREYHLLILIDCDLSINFGLRVQIMQKYKANCKGIKDFLF